jgi:ribosomal protein S18 acetylase RimI-like enzyme
VSTILASLHAVGPRWLTHNHTFDIFGSGKSKFLSLRNAQKGQARDCLSCVKNSELWETYFKSSASAENDIEKMISKKQIYVALNQTNECIGFMGLIHSGCFNQFSYLSLIAVESGYRNKGIGKQLLTKFEKMGFKQADKVFLLVSDFNQKVQSLYEKIGYKKVGKIPDLFKKGVSEHLLVKYKI